MLINNTAVSDVRVVKAAESFAKRGDNCIVLCFANNFKNRTISRNGVIYHKLNMFDIYSSFLKKRDLFKIYNNETDYNKYRVVNEENTSQKYFPNLIKTINKFKHIVLKNTPGLILKYIFIIRQYLYYVLFSPYLKSSSYDLLYNHEVWLLGTAVRSRHPSSILLYDAHELELGRCSWWPNNVKDLVVSLESDFIKNVDMIVTVSNGCAKIISEHYGVDFPLLLRNIPEKGNLVSCDINLREYLQLDKNDIMLVYTGNVSHGRGVHTLLQSLTYLPNNYHLVCVGNVSSEYSQTLNVLTSQKKLSGRLHLVDPVSSLELIDLISGADYAVLPIQNLSLSYYHCLPNKLFESVFARLPVLASNFPDMSKVIEDSCVGLTGDLSTPVSIANHIFKLKASYPCKLPVQTQLNFVNKYNYSNDFSVVYNEVKRRVEA